MKIISTLVLSLVAVSAFANAPKHKAATKTETTTTTTVAKKDCNTVPATEKEACMKANEAAAPTAH
jgi:hypothetical protein